MDPNPKELLRQVREALKDIRASGKLDDAEWRRISSALAAIDAHLKQPSAPSVEPAAPFLFIAMGDDKRAHLTWCADESEVRAAVMVAMFWLADGEELSSEHSEQLEANVEELLDSGALTFEGDPPLYLYRVGGTAPTAQAPQTVAGGLAAQQASMGAAPQAAHTAAAPQAPDAVTHYGGVFSDEQLFGTAPQAQAVRALTDAQRAEALQHAAELQETGDYISSMQGYGGGTEWRAAVFLRQIAGDQP